MSPAPPFSPQMDSFQESLQHLRSEAFKVMLWMTGALGWVWFSWSVWPHDRRDAPFSPRTWALSGALVAVTLLSYALRRWRLYGAMVVFVTGFVGVITGTLSALGTADVAYLYLLPVIFAGVLLGQGALLAVTLSVGVLMAAVGGASPALSWTQLVLPTLIVALTAVALSISTNNLHTALAWALHNYRQAHENALLARERKARLEQALKSLDKAMNKLQRTNARLVQVSHQAEEARKLKQQFAQTISHELRTPLNLIVGFTETMIKSPEYYGNPLPPAYLRDLSVVYRNASHLQSLVNDVLDLARLESAYMSLDAQELDIRYVIEDAVNTARGLVERRGLVLKTDLAPNLPKVWGDAVRLKQVLLNLLNNAARFTERGGVTVRAFARQDEVIVAVEDTGIGIPTENLTHVFESFRQLENPMQRRTEGAGLGLAISKQLIDLHGGRIWVESEVGVGSTFFFSLPVRPIETLALDERPFEAPTAEPRTHTKHVVLVVTRSSSSAALLSRHLPDWRTVIVADLAQAQIAARQLLPQAVILDSNAEEIADLQPEALLRLFALPHLSVITCPLPGEELLRQRLGADGYLIKPITREDLWDTLRQFGNGNNAVLVVDDDRDFVRLIGRMLSDPMHRYQVTYAYSGQEALEMARRHPPGLLLLDLNLSDMHGAEVIRALRADARLAETRVIVITAYEEIAAASARHGTVCVTQTGGLRPNDIIRWVQAGLDMS